MTVKDELGRGLAHPQGAPRGLLLHYIMRKISQKPCHGYEILQDIDDKTEGAWRPGAGSVYPILKRLVQGGYIQSNDAAGSDRRIYSITQKGLASLKEGERMFLNSGQKWMAMRRLFIELIDSDQLVRFLSDGTRGQFELAQEMLKTKMKDIPHSDLEYLLKEYKLSLERQLEWTNHTLSELKPAVSTKGRRK